MQYAKQELGKSVNNEHTIPAMLGKQMCSVFVSRAWLSNNTFVFRLCNPTLNNSVRPLLGLLKWRSIHDSLHKFLLSNPSASRVRENHFRVSLGTPWPNYVLAVRNSLTHEQPSLCSSLPKRCKQTKWFNTPNKVPLTALHITLDSYEGREYENFSRGKYCWQMGFLSKSVIQNKCSENCGKRSNSFGRLANVGSAGRTPEPFVFHLSPPCHWRTLHNFRSKRDNFSIIWF